MARNVYGVYCTIRRKLYERSNRRHHVSNTGKKVGDPDEELREARQAHSSCQHSPSTSANATVIIGWPCLRGVALCAFPNRSPLFSTSLQASELGGVKFNGPTAFGDTGSSRGQIVHSHLTELRSLATYASLNQQESQSCKTSHLARSHLRATVVC